MEILGSIENCIRNVHWVVMTGVIVEVRVENLVLDVDLVTTIVDIAVKNIRKVDRVLGQVVLDRHYNSLGVLIVDIENV